MKDYTQVERDNAALTLREYAFGQMNMLRMLGDEDAANNLQEAINMAIAALRTTQLDENGLARCGCGGKAVVWEGRMHSDTYYVQCLFCGVRTVDKVKKADAIREFNTAMGWKGGAE